MNRKTFNTLCIASAVALGATGCTTPAVESTPLEVLAKERTPAPLPEPDLSYTVQSGDRLGNIALAITGSTENWAAIADHNQIDDPRLLRVGDILIIPGKLVVARGDPAQVGSTDTAGTDRPGAEARANDGTRSSGGSNDGTGNNGRSNSGSGNSSRSTNSGAGNTAASNGSGALPLPDTDTAKVTVTAVADRPPPLELREQPEPRATPEPAATRSVEVSGSYYPRGIYAEPSGNARLIMRAAPGALLPLERSIDNWYRVTTSQGAGYIRASDARIVESSATPGSTASSN